MRATDVDTIDGPRHFGSVEEGLDEQGLSPAEHHAILGDNWLRLFGEVFR